MEDYAIVQDEYFYIKEQAFKAIGGIKQADKISALKDSKHKEKKKSTAQQNRESPVQKQKKRESLVSRQLKCPLHDCKMITVDLESVLIDYCPQCYGIWLDFGELERLYKKKLEKTHLFKDKLIKSADNRLEDSLTKNCPVCNKQLVKKKNYTADIFIDICQICGGIWLDSGEFATLYLENRKSSSAPDILAGVLGNYIDIKV